MAAITQTVGVKLASAPINLTRTTLTASDTLVYGAGAGQVLQLYNTTASPVVVTLTGDAPTPLNPAGYGGAVTTTGGKAVTVPASGWTNVSLDAISAFITGVNPVAVTGGTGVIAALYN
jgi:hypothetical protein